MKVTANDITFLSVCKITQCNYDGGLILHL